MTDDFDLDSEVFTARAFPQIQEPVSVDALKQLDGLLKVCLLQ
jgi:hypothetical protein